MDNLFRLCQHLRLRNPKGSGGNGYGKVVDFNAIELLDAHFDGVHFFKSEECLSVIAFANSLVFQTTE